MEFVSWIVEHYKISPHLTDLSFITLISLLPTVGMLAYFHGRPGRDQWTRTEKIGIPINLLLTGCLLFFLLSGKELGSATTAVDVVDETGQTVRREIPKQNLTKRLAIFFFENEDQNPALEWLQFALMTGCHYDLNQDPVFSVYSGYDDIIYQKISGAGFGNVIGVPMALEQKIAREVEREYFLGGSYRRRNDTLFVKTFLYETARGKLIAENSFQNTDIFTIIDQINDRLKRDLNVPTWHLETVPDLPVSEIMTASTEAYRQYILGSNQLNLENDVRTARQHFEKAVHADPTFALAYWALYQLYINLNSYDQAIEALNTTMRYIYKFPEAIQFAIKEEFYLVSEDPEKRMAVLDMWVQLYPDDIRGHFRRAQEYFKQFKIDAAIAEFNQILSPDPARRYYYRYIGNAYLSRGDFENALKYFNQYQQAFPKDYRSFLSLVDLFLAMGKYAKARDFYIDAQLLEPNEVSILINLANVERRQGNFTATYNQLQNAATLAKTPADRAALFNAYSEYHYQRGEIRQALDYTIRQLRESAKFLKPLDAMVHRMSNARFELYVMLNREDQALEQLNHYSKTIPNPWSRWISLGELQIACEREDTTAIRENIDRVAETLKIFGELARSDITHSARGRLFEIGGDYLNAILEYQQAYQYSPLDVTILTKIARCYRQTGNYPKAQILLENVLSVLPMHAETHLEMAKIYQLEENPDNVREHLTIVFQVWENADPEYPPCREARRLLNLLS